MTVNSRFHFFLQRAAAFVLAAAILLVIYAERRIVPFGDNTMLVWDMKFQYSAFMTWFSDVLHGRTSFLYSLRGGLGGSTIGLFSYYISSPLNLILFFFGKDNIEYAVTLLLVIKTGLASLNMQIFLNKDGAEGGRNNGWLTVLFGAFYALSSFAVCFQYNIMWMDGYLLLPLVIMGLDKLIRGGSGVMYSVTLGLCILCNYYIGFMVCLFCVIWYIFRRATAVNGRNAYAVRSFFRFLVYSILGGRLSFAVTLPGALTLKESSAERVLSAGDFLDFSLMFDPLKEIKYLFAGTFDANQGILGRYPMLYAGTLTLLLVVLFFISRRNALHEKAGCGAVLIVLFTGMLFRGPFLIWHCFVQPSGCYERNAFLWVFVMIYIANMESWNLVLRLQNMTGRFTEGKNTGARGELQTDAVACRTGMKKCMMIGYACLTVLCMAELIFNGVRIHEQQFSELYLSKESIDAGNSTYDGLAPYMEGDTELMREVVFSGLGDSFNMGYLYGMNSINQYSSAESEKTWNIYERYGLGKNEWESEMEYGYDATGLTADIFGVRYIFEEDIWDVDGYEKVAGCNGVSLYENSNSLPLAFAVKEDAANTPETDDYFELQNFYYQCLEGADDGSPYTEVEENGESVPEELLTEEEKTGLETKPQILRIDETLFTDGEKLVVENSDMIDTAVSACAACTESVTVGNKSLSAEVNIPGDGSASYVCFSVPYDENFRVSVDGNKTDAVSGMGGLMLVPVEGTGEHTVSITYVTPGLKEGVGMAVVSIVALAVLEYLRRRWNGKLSKKNRRGEVN